MIRPLKYNISFSDKRFDAVVCLNANLPNYDIFQTLNGLPIIAADGAAIKLLKMNIFPDFIIGDMDSFNFDPEIYNFSADRIIKDPNQENNDFEKVLLFLFQHNYLNILILGMHGGALEHTFNNWSVFKKFSSKLDLCLYDEDRYGFSVNNFCSIDLKKNELVSLIPQPYAKIKTENLKWKLNNEILELGIREGAHNVALQDNITLDVTEGELIVFIDSRLPYCPNVSPIQF